MKFEHTSVSNFENAIRGMRNPLNSWDKSDSYFGLIDLDYDFPDEQVIIEWIKTELNISDEEYYKNTNKKQEKLYDQKMKWLSENGVIRIDDKHGNCLSEVAFLGPNDMKLAQKLIKAGKSHRKFLRQIFVSVDISAPIFFFKELDTYKIGTISNSTSSMHTLVSEPITLDKFEIDDMENVVIEDSNEPTFIVTSQYAFATYIEWLEKLRQKYNETKDNKYWKELIRMLPSSWIQKRTWTCSYETILSICKQRKGHKLTEWHSFINWAYSLPYAKELIFMDELSKE